MFNLMVEFLILHTVFWIKPLKFSKIINVGAIMVDCFVFQDLALVRSF